MSCKHLKARMIQNTTFGFAFCPDCKSEVDAAEVLNNNLLAIQELKKQMDESIERIEAMFGR